MCSISEKKKDFFFFNGTIKMESRKNTEFGTDKTVKLN